MVHVHEIEKHLMLQAYSVKIIPIQDESNKSGMNTCPKVILLQNSSIIVL